MNALTTRRGQGAALGLGEAVRSFTIGAAMLRLDDVCFGR